MKCFWIGVGLSLALMSGRSVTAAATPRPGTLRAGTARVDITDREAGPVHDPCFAKVLVFQRDTTAAVLITVDAVAIGEIGPVGNRFLPTVRQELRERWGIPVDHIIVNASHCHGIVRSDAAALVVQAVEMARNSLVPVKVGAGVGHEDRISENRRMRLKDGRQADMRRAYSMPRDQDVAEVGPIDPEIGLLRVDREDDRPLAIVYLFACHPIMNPPSKGNSADYPAVASQVIEEAWGPGTTALFVQGCGGDINPLRYKEMSTPPDAEPLGRSIGQRVVHAVRQIRTIPEPELKLAHRMLALPRAADYQERIKLAQAERQRLVESLHPTNLNFKTFLPLLIGQRLASDFPSGYASSYLHDKALGRGDLERFDADNHASVEAYLENIESMEQLTRLNTNIELLRKHLKAQESAVNSTVDVDLYGIRVGDFRMVTFPGELTVQVGLNLKRAVAIPNAFVAGYTNGYIYYAPTAEQRKNAGFAQEDCDCIVAPEWQRIFESTATEMLLGL